MFWFFLITLCLIIFLFSIFLYNPKFSKKKFFITFLSISFSTSMIYFLKGNKEAFIFENLVSEEINQITNNPENLKEINPQKIIFFWNQNLGKTLWTWRAGNF